MTCVHVYEMVGADLCPHCGSHTHEQNWAAVNKKHDEWKEWILENPQELVWWSI
jgi:hypothetical protein